MRFGEEKLETDSAVDEQEHAMMNMIFWKNFGVWSVAMRFRLNPVFSAKSSESHTATELMRRYRFGLERQNYKNATRIVLIH